ncbi:hypothetical protein FOPG_09375 [Fusarium oxysporum f. sp. conglutinans race 2 54008]|uniref:Uncharacterized protein n=1 Tax=Fusarium oxysporum f. sp. conglutinans race 2 54008 TaxID=1089457 RepID=X0IRM2_FUSOX|nr:hypothetical protein FOPG_09375 [Fusarium oxysporum f. sp. conglutinans race 2 54008]
MAKHIRISPRVSIHAFAVFSIASSQAPPSPERDRRPVSTSP